MCGATGVVPSGVGVIPSGAIVVENKDAAVSVKDDEKNKVVAEDVVLFEKGWHFARNTAVNE